MSRPPRDSNENIFGRRTIGWSLLQGLIVLLVCLGVFIVAKIDFNIQSSRTMAFTTLIVANLTLILTNASWSRGIVGTLFSRNQALRWILGGAVLLLMLLLYVPPITRIFSFVKLSAAQIAVCVGLGVASVAWFEIVKRVMARRGESLLSTPEIHH